MGIKERVEQLRAQEVAEKRYRKLAGDEAERIALRKKEQQFARLRSHLRVSQRVMEDLNKSSLANEGEMRYWEWEYTGTIPQVHLFLEWGENYDSYIEAQARIEYGFIFEHVRLTIGGREVIPGYEEEAIAKAFLHPCSHEKDEEEHRRINAP